MVTVTLPIWVLILTPPVCCLIGILAADIYNKDAIKYYRDAIKYYRKRK